MPNSRVHPILPVALCVSSLLVSSAIPPPPPTLKLYAVDYDGSHDKLSRHGHEIDALLRNIDYVLAGQDRTRHAVESLVEMHQGSVKALSVMEDTHHLVIKWLNHLTPASQSATHEGYRRVIEYLDPTGGLLEQVERECSDSSRAGVNRCAFESFPRYIQAILPASTEPSDSPTSPPSAESVRISVGELMAEYKPDSAAAVRKYEGKSVLVEGVIGSVIPLHVINSYRVQLCAEPECLEGIYFFSHPKGAILDLGENDKGRRGVFLCHEVSSEIWGAVPAVRDCSVQELR